MSLEKIRDIFSNILESERWSLELLRIKISKKEGTKYFCREITLSPKDELKNIVTELVQNYIGEKSILKSYEAVNEYDGVVVGKNIYKLKVDNELIADEYDALVLELANPDLECDPFDTTFQAYVLSGIVNINGEEEPVKLITMQNPIAILKHKFACAKGTFYKISDKVISLKSILDVLIVGNEVYMFNLAGEKLFNMERAYKSVCLKKIEDVNQCEIVTDFSSFSTIASCGHNPRKFVSFNDEYLELLKKVKNRKKIAETFNIPFDGSKFTTENPEASEKLIKFLCGKGMRDPFNDTAMEVSSSKKWQ